MSFSRYARLKFMRTAKGSDMAVNRGTLYPAGVGVFAVRIDKTWS